MYVQPNQQSGAIGSGSQPFEQAVPSNTVNTAFGNRQVTKVNIDAACVSQYFLLLDIDGTKDLAKEINARCLNSYTETWKLANVKKILNDNGLGKDKIDYKNSKDSDSGKKVSLIHTLICHIQNEIQQAIKNGQECDLPLAENFVALMQNHTTPFSSARECIVDKINIKTQPENQNIVAVSRDQPKYIQEMIGTQPTSSTPTCPTLPPIPQIQPPSYDASQIQSQGKTCDRVPDSSTTDLKKTKAEEEKLAEEYKLEIMELTNSLDETNPNRNNEIDIKKMRHRINSIETEIEKFRTVDQEGIELKEMIKNLNKKIDAWFNTVEANKQKEAIENRLSEVEKHGSMQTIDAFNELNKLLINFDKTFKNLEFGGHRSELAQASDDFYSKLKELENKIKSNEIKGIIDDVGKKLADHEQKNIPPTTESLSNIETLLKQLDDLSKNGADSNDTREQLSQLRLRFKTQKENMTSAEETTPSNKKNQTSNGKVGQIKENLNMISASITALNSNSSSLNHNEVQSVEGLIKNTTTLLGELHEPEYVNDLAAFRARLLNLSTDFQFLKDKDADTSGATNSVKKNTTLSAR